MKPDRNVLAPPDMGRYLRSKRALKADLTRWNETDQSTRRVNQEWAWNTAIDFAAILLLGLMVLGPFEYPRWSVALATVGLLAVAWLARKL